MYFLFVTGHFVVGTAVACSVGGEVGAGTTQNRRYVGWLDWIPAAAAVGKNIFHAAGSVGRARQGTCGARPRKARLAEVLWARAKRDATRSCDMRLIAPLFAARGNRKTRVRAGRLRCHKQPALRSSASIFTSAASETLLADTIRLKPGVYGFDIVFIADDRHP